MAFTNFYNKRIFCDLDSTLSDFNAQWMLMTKTNMSPKKFEEMYGVEEFLSELKKYGVGFWKDMPLMEDAMFLWNYIDKYKPIILTKPIPTEECRIGKELWVRKYLPVKTEIIFAEEKEQWADPHSLLIDDLGINVRKFIIAGGEGIIHTSSIETIKELKEKYGL